jgi:hypothetical protein
MSYNNGNNGKSLPSTKNDIMKRTIFSTLMAMIFISCGSNDPSARASNTAEDSTTATESRKPVDSPHTAGSVERKNLNNKVCYANFKNKDKVLISFTVMDSLVTGDLAYRYYEKDENKGTVNGIMRGDTIIAEYTFESEGIMSVREVVFLKKGNTLVEGFGDVEDSKGKMIFKDLSTLTFDNSVVLEKINCEKSPAIK